jgi:hypothetical protein
MSLRLIAALLFLSVAACAPPRDSAQSSAPLPQEAQQLNLYASASEVRLFANPLGFEFNDSAPLDQLFDRDRGAPLSAAEIPIVSQSVTVLPPPADVAACAHFWRHAFVFYSANGTSLGALAYCMECGAVIVVGPEDPGVELEQLGYDSEALNGIIENHRMVVEPQYPEYSE